MTGRVEGPNLRIRRADLAPRVQGESTVRRAACGAGYDGFATARAADNGTAPCDPMRYWRKMLLNA